MGGRAGGVAPPPELGFPWSARRTGPGRPGPCAAQRELPRSGRRRADGPAVPGERCAGTGAAGDESLPISGLALPPRAVLVVDV